MSGPAPDATAPDSTAPADTAPDATASVASVSTHVLDTAAGRPAAGVAVELSTRSGGDADGPWSVCGSSVTDADGRCRGLPPPPEGATHVRLRFDVGPYAARGPAGQGAFFPEVAVVFAVAPGEHHHVPLLLSPFGYSVYRGS
ncbi:hydroxyisourate hydrolase [Streptomyces hiroshimensis]|uniref:5-hydroxyisourate hydrolase n=1 Tax=Streptomyces hiroshimensis TaxID=66424 RepID=A0ABQ2Y4Z1_9ACTN|nr:hydroxyisourate hydrolase [Streptomyces hiroshimensis]GGX62650.1 5-hydroxyisourate hydrolase [Streptomyces hiroshimensis]